MFLFFIVASPLQELAVASEIPSSTGIGEKQKYFGTINVEEKKPMASYRFKESILIVYSSTSSLVSETANKLYHSLRLIYLSTELKSISSVSDLKRQYSRENVWIVIYVFNTTLKGIYVGEEFVEWKNFANILTNGKNLKHILAMGNTKGLHSYIKTARNVYFGGVEQIDAELLFLYAAWTVAEILDTTGGKFENAGLELRYLSIKYFGENFNDLLERTIIPKAPLGEEDRPAKMERYQKILERFQKDFRKVGILPPENYTTNDLFNNSLKVSVDRVPPPRVEIKFRDKVDPEEELIISEIPLKSGLDGPIATVLDLLMTVLISRDKGVGDVLTISTELARCVKEIFDSIKIILGFIEGDTASALKELFNLMKDQFPFMEDYKKYFDLFVSAIYVLRGDLSEILNFVSQIIELVFPETSDIIDNLKNILNELLDVDEEFYNRIKSSDSVFKEILSWFSEKISEGVIEKFLSQTLGLTGTEIEESISKIVSTFNTVVNFLSTFNVTSLLTNICEKVIQIAFNIFNGAGDREILEKATMVINLGMVVLGYSSQSLKESLVTFLGELIGESNFKDDFEGIKDTVQEILKTIDDAIKNEKENINEFKAQIRTIIEEALTSSTVVSENMKSLVVDSITLIAGVLNDKFTKSELPTLIPIIVNIIRELKPGVSSEITEKVGKIVETAVAIIGFVRDDEKLKQMVSRTVEEFVSRYVSPEDLIKNAVEFILSEILDESKFNQIKSKILIISEIGGSVYKIIESFKDDPLQGIMLTFLEGASFSLLKHYYSEIDLGNYTKILQVLFPRAVGLEKVPTPEEALKIILNLLGDVSESIKDAVEQVLGFVFSIRDIFTDGFKWIFNTVMGWLLGKVEELINDLTGKITNKIGGLGTILYDGGFGLGLMGGESFLGFGIDIRLALDLGIGFDKEAFVNLLSEMIFGGYDWDKGSLGDIFKRLFSFFQFIPVFKAELGINGFGAVQEFLNHLLESIGMELQVSGGASFEIQLLKFKGGSFGLSGFFKVIGWSFWFKIEMSKEFTILDFFSGGVGTSILADLMEYIGLDMIKIIISFGIGLEIVKRAASAIGPEQGTFTLQITIGAALLVPIDLLIIAVTFYGSLKIVFTFIQNFVGSPPFKFMFDLLGYVEFTIDFRVLFFDKTWSWGPTSLVHYKYTAGSADEEEVKNNALGYDSDGDGLSDDYELNTPGLDPYNPDTDGDGLTDKEESQITHTDPLNNDTDSDKLTDKEEIEQYHTNPRWDDSDNDGLTDYEEVKIYGTNPLCRDTDEDGLDDAFEITHTWDTNSTPELTLSVKEVLIGGVPYANHTDPLNPDTDNDGLLDGEEGPLGPYYGLKKLYNESSPQVDPDPLIFGNGYTHPLDNDTDDDSYLQLWNGWIAPSKTFLRSMTDGEEVRGIWAVFMVNGTPKRMLIRTNPCNPDTDGDTGADRSGLIPADEYLNSDGYELHLVPPSNPLNADTDGDGLIDGLEGTLRSDSNHTFYLDPDTDGDGLGDLQDLLLGTDPRNPDTDHDQVSDGDEYYKYGTNPVLPDTDFDLLTDGEELFFWHSNPHLMDSDGDGLIDGAEVLYYFTDPMDEDMDDDGLTDYEELKIYFTNVFNPDTDGDGISDGDEIHVYLTNPFNWDSDNDSIVYPNEFGKMTWPMSDYDEIFIYGTDPLRSDTDGDGLIDSYELYLANGSIPNFENIPLDAKNNDTDGDGISDGAELRILNISNIIYPYLTLKPYYYYNSSPVLYDTDGDNVSDYDEIFIYGSFPNNNESDGDTIEDGVEVNIYGTDPSNNDTDGDGVDDYEEIFIYGTNPSDSDGDDDLLPDGFELHFQNRTLTKRTFFSIKQVNLDPFDPDVNDNGILDGYEVDSDGDGLSDGEEFYIYETQTFPGGGFLNPDTDGDGISDGAEVYEYKTSPVNPDTDGDGFSDGAEVAVGTDPTQWTSQEEYDEALRQFRKGIAIKIISPKNETIADKTLDVRVVNSTNIVSMWGRYYDGNAWSSNFTLIYNSEDQQWVNSTLMWKKGSYRLQVFAKTVSGYIVWDEVYFTFKKPAILPLWLLIIMVAAAVGVAVFLLLFFFKTKKKPVSLATETATEKEEKKEEQGNKKKTENTSKIWGRKMRKIRTKVFRSLRTTIVLSIIAMFLFSTIQGAILPAARNTNTYPQKVMSNNIVTENLKSPGGKNYEGSYYSSDFDLFKYLSNNPNEYQRIWEPWLTKAAVHAIAASDDGQFIAVGGGYLYDNEIHIYRWNNETVQYEKVWDSGDGIIDGDVISLDFGDTDNNHFIEIVAGSADGHIYVFEQRHIYDPFTNTENQFNFVWKSNDMPPVWSIVVEDVDKDYKPDIIAGTWDNKVHIYEYSNHSGYPFSEEQWITYDEVWNSGLILNGKIFSLATGDTNYNALPEIIVGTYNGTIYIFENNGTILHINGKPFPLTSDNKYKLIWNSSNVIWNPITSISTGNLDGDPYDEIAIVSRGQGVYVINYDEDKEEYLMQKLVKPLQTWEAMGAYPLDYWVDRMINGTLVYYFENGTIYMEPINYTVTPEGVKPNITTYPRNTAMAGEKDEIYSQLNSTIIGSYPNFVLGNATAVLDFGRHEEATGNGNDLPDLNVTFIVANGFEISPNFNNLLFYVSPDGSTFAQIPVRDISNKSELGKFYVEIDLDALLAERRWDYVRYIKIVVTGLERYAIDSVEVLTLNRPLDTATAATIGYFAINSTEIVFDKKDYNSIIIGTVEGRIIAFQFNETSKMFYQHWDSYEDVRFKAEANIWAIRQVNIPGKLPVWWTMNPLGSFTLSLPFGQLYSSMTILDLDDDSRNEAIIGTQNGTLLLFEPGYQYNATATNKYFNKDSFSINQDPDYRKTSLSPCFAELDADIDKPELILGYFNYSQSFGGNPAEDLYVAPYAGLDYCTYDATHGYYVDKTLSDLEVTGYLEKILSLSTALPEVDAADIDYDGDMDLVMTNGKIYLIENIGNSSSPKFAVKFEYFTSINSKYIGVKFTGPKIVDFDSDGDMDLIVCYADKTGATYFENIGTYKKPIWNERRELFIYPNPLRSEYDFSFSNLTDPIFYSYMGTLKDFYINVFGTDLIMNAYNNYTRKIVWFNLDFKTPTKLMIATYPKLAMYEICIADGLLMNFGYRISEVWNNEYDLNNWTITVETGDIDGDGRKEVVVGDFDNNVYVFEHLRNNTYKRAFRSMDFIHTIVTNESPYAWEELEGISGEFNRTIWDHVEHLVAGVDLDKDGKEEIIAAAHLSIYLFEWTGIDDHYTLIFHQDVSKTGWNTFLEEHNVTKITALEFGDDVDKKNDREIFFAARNYMFMIPCTSDNSFGEPLLLNPVGNPPYFNYDDYISPSVLNFYENLTINTILSADIDSDSEYELIFGGKNSTNIFFVPNGFLTILKINKTAGKYETFWNAPQELTEKNPINIVVMDDQDYDGFRELIIGHAHGIDIWEINESKLFTKMEVITSSPNYPIIHLNKIWGLYRAAENLTGRWFPGRNLDIYQLSNNTLMLICAYDNGTDIDDPSSGEKVDAVRLYVLLGSSDGKNWGTPYRLTSDSEYGGRDLLLQELEPSIIQLKNGEIWITWRAETVSGTTRYYEIYYKKYSPISGWLPLNRFSYSTSDLLYSPSIWECNDSLNIVGLSYMLESTGEIRYRVFDGTLWWPILWPYYYVVPNIGKSSSCSYEAVSSDMINLADGGYALVFSGRFKNESKPDYDIWVYIANNSRVWKGRPVRLTFDPTEEGSPSISQLRSPDRSIVVVFESYGGYLGNRIQICYSKDHGRHWSKPEALSFEHPDLIITERYGQKAYNVSFGVPPVKYEVIHYDVYCPAITGLNGEGFTYATITHVIFLDGIQPNQPKPSALTVDDIVTGYNPTSNWTKYDVGSVVALAVGDTDVDARREIAANYYDKVTLFEITHIGTMCQEHNQVWMSYELGGSVRDIDIGDLNKNTWPEIVVSAERGNVYSFEIADRALPQTLLNASLIVWNYTVSSAEKIKFLEIGVFDYGNRCIAAVTYHMKIFTLLPDGTLIWNKTVLSDSWIVYDAVNADLNKDGIDDIVLGGDDTNVYAISGKDGDLMWVFKGSPSTIRCLAKTDLNMDNIPDILIGATNKVIYAIDGKTGVELWNISLPDYHALKLVIGNLTGDAVSDLIAVTWNSTHAFDGHSHVSLWSWEFSHLVNIYYDPLVLDLNDDSVDDVVIAEEVLYAISGQDGTVIWNNTDVNVTMEGPWDIRYLETVDLNGDGTLEIVAAMSAYSPLRYKLFVIDAITGITEWSTGQVGAIVTGGIASDVDNDGTVEILLVSREALAAGPGTIIVFDVLRKTVEWFYRVTDTYPTCIAVEDIDSDGVVDIVVGVQSGVIHMIHETCLRK